MALSNHSSSATLSDYKTRLLRVLVYIQQHLDEPLSLDELAALACFSPYHFHRVFKGMIGESLQEHIRRLRLERALQQLKSTQLPIIQIALAASYQTHEAFTRSFKNAFGCSPTQYRARNTLLAQPKAPSGVHYAQGEVANFKVASGKVMNVTIKELEPMRVAFMRHVGPYDQVGETWDKVMMWLGKEGWIGGDTMYIGLCHDDPEVTPADKIRYDACITIDNTFQAFGEICVQTITGKKYAMNTHIGPYNKLGRTYSQLYGQWLPRSGYALRLCPCFEVYLNDPHTTEPQELLTDIYMPIQ